MFFNNQNKPGYSTATTTSPFTIGTNSATNQAPFGHSPLFGSPSSGCDASSPIFAPTAPKPRGLFSSSSTTQQPGFGTNLFTPQQTASTNSESPLLGSSGYGQQNKGFGFAFGATPTSSFEQKGSVVKFMPAMGTDMVSQNGVCRTINIKFNCIVCMKEYETKSQEELRWEDYESNRKGPQQPSSSMAPTFGTSPVSAPYAFEQTENKMAFVQTGNTPMFGQVKNRPMFGQTENKPNFGHVENKTFFAQPTNLTNQPNEQSSFGKQFGSYGLTPLTNKPFSFAATSPSFGVTATSPAFAGKSFSSPPAQNTFNASTPVTSVAQPISFGSYFGQTNPQTQNTSLFNKPSQPMFNFSQMGQTNSQTNMFQPIKATTGFPSFGKSDSAASLSIRKTASDISLLSAGKIDSSNFNIGQQANLSQPIQNSFGAMQSPAQSTSRQSLSAAFGTEMQSMTNTDLRQPAVYGAYGHTPNYGFPMPQQQQQQLASPFNHDQPEDFRTIVDKVYECFPYRSIFDGIPVKLFMDENTTNPMMLNKIMKQECLPITSTYNKAKLRMLTGPQDIPLKYKWLDAAHASCSNLNNFTWNKKSGKQLRLSKNQPKHEEVMKKLLARISDDNLRHHFQEQLNIDNTSTVNTIDKNCKSQQNLSHEVLEDVITVSGNAEKSEATERVEEVRNNNDIFELQRRILQNENKVKDHTSPNTTSPQKPESKEDNSFNNDDSSENEQLQNFVTPPSVKSSLKDLLISDQNFKTGLKAKFPLNQFPKKLIENRKLPEETIEPTGVGDNASDNPSIFDTCGIRLARKDYYTIPPLEDIHKFQNEKGECMVTGFTVGRHGFGNVYFSDEIDVSNLDLDEIIHFHFREATIYPDDSKKPPVGQGLNRPGQITLECVWPRHPITRQIIKDPKDLEAENFIERLTLLSRKQDAFFVDYLPDSGSWIFRVEHFSIFNFTESDDEEVTKELAAAEHKHEMKKKKVESRRGLGGNKLDKMDDVFLQKTTPQQSISQEKLTSLFEKGSNNVMMMKCSFFDEFTSNGTSHAALEPAQDLSIAALTVSTNSNFYGLKKRTVTCPPKYTPLFNHKHTVPKGKSLVISSTGSYMDGGLFKGKSFKTGWGPAFLFMTGGASLLDLNPYSISERYEEAAPNAVKCYKVGEISRNPQIMYLKEHLQVVFAQSTVAQENSQVPVFTINKNHRSLISHQNIAESLDIVFGMKFSHYRHVWNLCLALWGPDATTPTNKRDLFSKWLEDVTSDFFKNELKQGATIKNIFTYLTDHKITEAAKLAENNHLPHLSILITQASGQESSKQLVRNQLEQWDNARILNEIDKDIVKIYMLLGAVPVLCGINVCEDLDWKRALAVYFWYMCPAGTSLIYSVLAYQSAVASGLANPPTPERYECTTNVKVYDVLYQIMLLFITPTMPLERVLNPITYTDDPLDYQLSWFLLQVFTALQLGTVSQQVTNSIHVSFSSQVERLGLWDWSIFVLLFVKDKSYKANAIMAILERNLDPDKSSKQNTTAEDILVNYFKIPSEWIHSVLADKTSLVGNGLETYQHLILAKNWCKAHEVAVKRLIPHFITNRQWENLFVLLKRLIPGKGDILRWDKEVGLVLDYLEFYWKIKDNKHLVTEMHVRQLRGELAGICFRVKDFPTTSPKQKVAVAELSQFLVSLLKFLYCDLQPTNVISVQIVVWLVKVLPMPPDYKQSVLKEMSMLYFKT